MILPVLTIILGSFLLFGVQPMLGRMLLPHFGGTAAVWTTCLAAYQALLLVGYLYAHTVSKWSLSRQRIVHGILLGTGALWTFLLASMRETIKGLMGNTSQPALEVLFCVTVLVGLPYVLLSSGSSLLQSWLAREGKTGRDVYKLYAVSNFGSFLGLLAYPIVFEPHLSIKAQWWGFGVSFALYGTLLSLMGSRIREVATKSNTTSAKINLPSGESQQRKHRWLWFTIPGVSVFMLNAVTTNLTLNVMPMPLLWTVLLSAFLLSYVLGFSDLAKKGVSVFAYLALVLGVAMAWSAKADMSKFFMLIALGEIIFFFCSATFLHMWLYQLRPDVKHLTLYYLGNAVGGATGGLLASLAAPMVFKSIAEYLIALCLLSAMLVVWALQKQPRRAIRNIFALAISLVGVGIVAAGLTLNI